ncbi:histidine kinase [bacterium]|nr:histidine kinase [bacterium]
MTAEPSAPSETGVQDEPTESRGSIARRMLVMAIAWSALVLAIAGWSLLALYRGETEQRLDETVDATLGTLLTAVDSTDAGQMKLDETRLPNDPRFDRVFSGWYWAFLDVDDTLKVVDTFPSRSLWDARPALPASLIESATADPGAIQRATGVGPQGESIRIAVRSVSLPDRGRPVLLYAAIDRTAADAAASRFAFRLAVSLAALAIGLAGGALVLIRFGLKPLLSIESSLADIRSGRQERLRGSFPRELAPLVRELNTLIAHNRKVVERARTQVGNLAHALKTPLAVLINEARGDDKLSEVVRRQADAMSSNVNHYLKRAQAAAQAEVLGARSEVAPAVEDIGRMLERLYRSKDCTVEVDADPNAVFRGERGDLDELVGNLLENAAKWCKSSVKVKVSRAGAVVEICVDDDGPGLAREDRAKALERGRRLDESEPGTGLGLSIVRDLAEIYGGRFHLEDSPLGGLRARLELPAAAT